jgi:hypothetical protein
MDNLLLSCCYGLGIGTARSLKTALPYCVRAALSGDIPALLTSITLFDICQRTYTQGELNSWDDGELKVLPVEISGWKDENREPVQLRYEHTCGVETRSSLVPTIFNSTPAARSLCDTYSTIRQKLAIMTCPVCGSSDDIDENRRGWQLLHNLMEHIETKRIEYEFGTIGTVLW